MDVDVDGIFTKTNMSPTFSWQDIFFQNGHIKSTTEIVTFKMFSQDVCRVNEHKTANNQFGKCQEMLFQ